MTLYLFLLHYEETKKFRTFALVYESKEGDI